MLQQQPKQHHKRRRKRLGLWNTFVLLVGYGTLLYGLARGLIYLLVLLGGNGV